MRSCSAFSRSPIVVPTCAPTTPPMIRKNASTMSTVWLVTACSQRGEAGHEDDLEQRGADHDLGRHPQQVDHGRHHQEAAAHPMIAASNPTSGPIRSGGMTEMYRPEARNLIFSGSAWTQLCSLRRGGLGPAAATAERAQAFDEHQRADDAEEHDVAELYQQVDLPAGEQR
jgi:hypothetical protein